ncbi:MAG TPA: RDD family protein, partial [Holophaga sp.]|nr:RDD family protein [Holophaga sp.]
PAPAAQAAHPAPEFLQPYLPPVPDTAQPLLAGGGIERGDFATRMVAFLLDLAPLTILVVLHMVVASVFGNAGFLLALLGSLVSLGLGLAYLAFQLWCLVAFRATLGKKIQRLRVVPETHPSANIDWTMALLRLAGHLVNVVFLGLPTLLILGAERKGLEDLLSGSVVIKVDR